MSTIEDYASRDAQNANLNLLPSDTIELEEPDLQQMRVDRMERNKTAMQAIDASVMKTVMGSDSSEVSVEERAAIVLQARYRGRLGRKIYLNKLFALFEKEEALQREKMLQQVEEGQLLVDKIQRAWRAYRNRVVKHDEHLLDTHSTSSSDASSSDHPMSVSSVDSSMRCSDDSDLKTSDQTDENLYNTKNVAIVESEPDSTVSDYSEMSEHVKEHLANVKLIEGELLIEGEAGLSEPVVVCNPPVREANETVEEYAKRVRKFNFLSLAQEFAALKKVEADASPFDIHLGMYGNSEGGESSGESSDACSLSPSDAGSEEQTMTTQVDGNQNQVARAAEGAQDNSGDFDVYNMESTLPQMDWASLEQSLNQSAKQNQKGSRHNDREEIRRRLAMASEEEYYGPERSFKKPNLQTRLQGGMKLQMCYLNEASTDGRDNESQRVEPNVQNSAHLSNKPLPQHSTSQQKVQTEAAKPPPAKSPAEDGDFFSRQARLQAEARIALAQARPMAHMQLEVERQLRKKSPIAQIVGIPGIGDGTKCRLSRLTLSQMNIAQLQVVVNDLHAQIEAYNEELVHLLVERDDLHMEQDSKLVDIEDFTRRAQELCSRLNNSNHKRKEKRK